MMIMMIMMRPSCWAVGWAAEPARSLWFCCLLVALCCCPLQAASRQHVDPDEGTLSSVKPRIPEPMVVDLVRPLGAARGEVEVNSLFRFLPATRPRTLQWAPEVEYAFREGYGVEFEIPAQNGAVEAWKGALQGTLRGPWRRSFIHGWQLLAEKNRGHGSSKVDALYLAGVRWHPRWSAFTMSGLEREGGVRPARAWLGNYSLFYHRRDALHYGLESNWKGRGNSGRALLVMPQAHFRVNRLNFQLGAGWQQTARARGVQIGWRLSREF